MTIALNRLNDRFIDYVLRGKHRDVGGWIEPGALAGQRSSTGCSLKPELADRVAEIGVHHGQRFFIALCLLRRPGERALAIDIFDDQHLNVDNSGLRQHRETQGEPDPIRRIHG